MAGHIVLPTIFIISHQYLVNIMEIWKVIFDVLHVAIISQSINEFWVYPRGVSAHSSKYLHYMLRVLWRAQRILASAEIM
jgi:hypothetical protein